MLLELFKEKRCFKLVCGAGNEDATEVEKLVTLYSKAGCNFFDLCAKPEIVDAAKKGLERAGIKDERYLCCSVGIQGDPHVSKALINPQNCMKCGKCASVCLQRGIEKSTNAYEINKIRCIGCGKCIKICPSNTIEMTSEFKDLKEVLPPLIAKGIDCVEFHMLGDNVQEINEKWTDINNLFAGPLSINIDRSKLGNEDVVKRVKELIARRKPYTTIIQTDGIAMSGQKDDFRSTLQAVSMADLFESENLPVYLMLSGGTNSKTTELCKLCDISPNGVAIGTFAREIVRDYIDRDDFLNNKEAFNSALEIARNLVKVSLENMR